MGGFPAIDRRRWRLRGCGGGMVRLALAPVRSLALALVLVR